MKQLLLLLSIICLSVTLRAQTAPIKTDTSKTVNQVFTAVEVNPTFEGGMAEFYKYLAKNIRYPAADFKSKTQGRVYIVFVVEKDGSLSDFKIMRAPSETLGAEALRVVSASPKWIPGMQNNKPVRVQFTVPINFALN